VSNETAPAAKVCQVCKQDCSARPRQKDAQGRYTCKECLDKAAARRASPKAQSAAPEVDPGLAAALAGVDQAAMTPCSNCGILLKPDAVLCTACGFDISKGRATRTRVQELSSRERGAVEKAPMARSGVNISFEPSHMYTLSALGFAGLAFWAYSDFGVVPVMYAALGVMYYATLITMIVGAFKDDDGGWAILGLVSLVFPISYLAILYYIFGRSDRGMVKAMTLAFVTGLILFMFVLMGHVNDLKDAPPGKNTPATRTQEEEPDEGADKPEVIKFPGGA
jgi:hypothetical protein